jgi:hypothetical protein
MLQHHVCCFVTIPSPKKMEGKPVMDWEVPQIEEVSSRHGENSVDPSPTGFP